MKQTTEARKLSREEERFVLSRGMGIGYDKDTCSPQLSHIVYHLSDVGLFALCRSEDLWFGSHGGGTLEEEITCTKCLASLGHVMAKKSSIRLGAVGPIFDELMVQAKDSYRPDLYNLLSEIQKSWVLGGRLRTAPLAKVLASSLSSKHVQTLDVLNQVINLDWLDQD